MKKLNNKGFALVETLIVSAFVMGIFTVLFTNYYPMIGEYEKRENYDDIDSVYKTYYIKNLIERNAANFSSSLNQLLTPDSFCLKIPEKDKDYCNTMLDEFKVEKIIYSTYQVSTLKSSSSLNDDQNLKEYVKNLPKFSKSSDLKYRITVEYRGVINIESNNKRTIYKFSTIGVDGQ